MANMTTLSISLNKGQILLQLDFYITNELRNFQSKKDRAAVWATIEKFNIFKKLCSICMEEGLLRCRADQCRFTQGHGPNNWTFLSFQLIIGCHQIMYFLKPLWTASLSINSSSITSINLSISDRNRYTLQVIQQAAAFLVA